MSVAILGTGRLGEMLLRAFLRGNLDPDHMYVTARLAERASQLAEKYPVHVISNLEAIEKAETIFFAVGPQDIVSLVKCVGPAISTRQIVVSLAAGVSTSTLERELPEGVPVLRVMTSTLIGIGQAVSAVSAGRYVQDCHLKTLANLLEPTWCVVVLPESQQDAATAMCGGGVALFYYIFEALIDAGIFAGMSRASATEAVVQSAVGAAAMMCETCEHPAVLRDRAVSPGGTTAQALHRLEVNRVRGAFAEAVWAAKEHCPVVAQIRE